jgi:hypothetical protein
LNSGNFIYLVGIGSGKSEALLEEPFFGISKGSSDTVWRARQITGLEAFPGAFEWFSFA